MPSLLTLPDIIYFIYTLTNTVNGKIYVGQTATPRRRYSQHKSRAKAGSRKTPLYAAIKHYGFFSFAMRIIDWCVGPDDADILEEWWIQKLQTRNRSIGYNLAIGGRINRGYKHTTKWKRAQSKRKKAYYKTHKPHNAGLPMSQLAKDHLSDMWAGEKAVHAKFTNAEVRKIRDQFLTLQFSINELAKQHNISMNSMEDILKNVRYIDPVYAAQITSGFWKKQKAVSKKKCGAHSKKPVKDNNGNAFETAKDAAKHYGIHENTVVKILKGKRKGRNRSKYWFFYIEEK